MKAPRLKAKKKLDKDFSVLPKLSKEKHVTNDDDKTVKRPYQFFHKMYMNYNHNKWLKSYYSILYDT